MELRGITREWLEALDPAEFLALSSMISDIQRERAEARHRKLEERRRAPVSRGGRYLRLERVKCGKKGCRRCTEGELHGPYWYLYRPKKNGPGRTSEYVGKTLPEALADEFGVSRHDRTAG
ncbi:MAG: hypothetical protein M3151_03395 [Actinomycetota bacterium]|nr:hypothetical protein [Actinomycetota bacterium]